MFVNQPGRPPTWLWLFSDIWATVMMLPGMGCAYLIATGRPVSGVAALVAWIGLLWVIASAMERRRYARRWIILTGGVIVFAVSVAFLELVAAR